MKIIPIAASISMAASQALAGSITPVEIVEPEVMEESAPMGSGSSAWIIPLILIGVIALVASSDDSSSPSPSPGPTPGPGPTP